MNLEAIRSILDIVDDPHAFATCYVNHVENCRKKNHPQMSVTAAAHLFVLTGEI